MFRKIATAATVLLAAFALTGCAAGNEGPVVNSGGDEIFTYTVPFEDGSSVNCLVYDGYKAGGLECIWEDLNASGYETSYELLPSVETVGESTYLCVTYDGYKAGGIDCNI